jgi:hypothetical protein
MDQSTTRQELAQGQETKGGVISLIKTTSHSAWRAAGLTDPSRVARVATNANPAATIIVSANQPSIEVSLT